jgi:Fic family protein
MRGKKSDQTFVAEFISECVQHGIETPDEIIQDAKKKIEQIDQEIRAIDAKKILRSKLIDVILTFEKQVKTTSEDAALLPFFKLEYPGMCKFICDIVKKKPI